MLARLPTYFTVLRIFLHLAIMLYDVPMSLNRENKK